MKIEGIQAISALDGQNPLPPLCVLGLKAKKKAIGKKFQQSYDCLLLGIQTTQLKMAMLGQEPRATTMLWHQ